MSKSRQIIGECLDDVREGSGMAVELDKVKGICKELQQDAGHAQQLAKSCLPARIN
jgi:hypothetical protein